MRFQGNSTSGGLSLSFLTSLMCVFSWPTNQIHGHIRHLSRLVVFFLLIRICLGCSNHLDCCRVAESFFLSSFDGKYRRKWPKQINKREESVVAKDVQVKVRGIMEIHVKISSAFQCSNVCANVCRLNEQVSVRISINFRSGYSLFFFPLLALSLSICLTLPIPFDACVYIFDLFHEGFFSMYAFFFAVALFLFSPLSRATR